MIKSNQQKKEEILKKLEDLQKKGVKPTEKNISSVNPQLHAEAKELFDNKWMNVKNAFYNYMETTKNPQKNLQRLLVKKIEELEETSEIEFMTNNKINRSFTKYVEQSDPYLKEIIFNTFLSWDNFSKVYMEFNKPVNPEFSEEELIKGLTLAIESENIIQENLIQEKYNDIYNAIVNKYGSVKNGLTTLLSEAVRK